MCAMVCIHLCVYTYILHLIKGDWVGRVNTEVRFHRGEALHDAVYPLQVGNRAQTVPPHAYQTWTFVDAFLAAHPRNDP